MNNRFLYFFLITKSVKYFKVIGVSMASILEEIENRNAELYAKAKIVMAEMRKPITEIPRQPEKETVFGGMDKKTGMAIYHNVRL